MAAPEIAIEVTLDQVRRLEFTGLARYRLGSLERTFDFDDLKDRRRGFAALVAWVWACLVPEDAKAFPTPEALAPHITIANQADVMQALFKAIAAAGENEKNGRGSTPKPSPTSS